MQSSTAIAIRALIMLIVLVSVPLVAIFGNRLPDVFKGLLEGRGLVLGPAPGGSANAPSGGQNPMPGSPFSQPGPYRAAPNSGLPPNSASTLPNQSAQSGTGANGRSGLNASSIATSEIAQPGAFTSSPATMPPTMRASLEPNSPVPMGATMRATTTPATNFGQIPATTATNDWRNPPGAAGVAQPVGFQVPADAAPQFKQDVVNRDQFVPSAPSDRMPAEQTSPYVATGFTDPKGAAAPSALAPAPLPVTGDEKFHQVELKLRELGASHYLLETWGADNGHYRFVCKMAIGGNPGVNRYFQAIEDDPWRAMSAVLHQVEEWRSQQQ